MICGQGDTPAHKAARMGYGRTLKVLQELGVDMSMENVDVSWSRYVA